MASKFIKNITNSQSTLATRASLIEKQAMAAQTSIITALELEQMEIQSKIQAMLDFAPDSSYSLKPNNTNFNAPLWAKELNGLKGKLVTIEEELEIAKETYNDLFSDLDAESTDSTTVTE